jgi:hypothetical protein
MLVTITKDAVAAVMAGAKKESLTLADARRQCQWVCDRAIIMTADC